MPVFVYVLLGIALLITLILISKAKVFLCYDDELRVYAKFWFVKINIVPEKKGKHRKRKKKTKQAPAQQEKLPTEQKKEKPVAVKLWEMKTVLIEVLNSFLNKLHFRFLKLRIVIACSDAAKTALLYAGASQGVAYIIEILRNISNVDVSRNSNVSVSADFISQESELEGKIELYIRVFSLISVGIHAIKEYFKYKSTKED